MSKIPIERILELSDRLPLAILIDIKSRMGDWILSGGKQDDPYMWQQVRFAENYIKMKRNDINE